MTRDEFKIIIKGLKANYAQTSFIPDADAFDVWYGLLKDIPNDVAKAAAQTWMMQNAKIPTAADIRELSFNMQTGEQENDSEAWDMVMKAIGNSAYNSAAEFEKLPPLVQKTVGSASQLRQWAIDESFNAGVESSNFKKVYRQVQEREKKKALLSPDITKRLEELREGIKLIG